MMVVDTGLPRQRITLQSIPSRVAAPASPRAVAPSSFRLPPVDLEALLHTRDRCLATPLPAPRCSQLSWVSHPEASRLSLPVRPSEEDRLGAVPRFHRRSAEASRLLSRGDSRIATRRGPTSAPDLVGSSCQQTPRGCLSARPKPDVRGASAMRTAVRATSRYDPALADRADRLAADREVEEASPPGCPDAVPSFDDSVPAACVTACLADRAVVVRRAATRRLADLCHLRGFLAVADLAAPCVAAHPPPPTEAETLRAPAPSSTLSPHDPDQPTPHFERACICSSVRPRAFRLDDGRSRCRGPPGRSTPPRRPSSACAARLPLARPRVADPRTHLRQPPPTAAHRASARRRPCTRVLIDSRA
jgi:hypothetical protein